MSSSMVYEQIHELLDQHLDEQVDKDTRERLTLLVLGIIQSESASPGKIAKALDELGMTNATAENIERRIRRIENDPEISAILCFHPFARERLLYGKPKRLLLILDPTTQDDRVVKLTAAVWYRGRALPLVWMIWPANQPLKGDGLWKRVDDLLDTVAKLLPVNTPVMWVADRAFGSPSFIDLLTARGWSYIVRVVKTTDVRMLRASVVRLAIWFSNLDNALRCAVECSRNGVGVLPVWWYTGEKAMIHPSVLSVTCHHNGD